MAVAAVVPSAAEPVATATGATVETLAGLRIVACEYVPQGVAWILRVQLAGESDFLIAREAA